MIIKGAVLPSTSRSQLGLPMRCFDECNLIVLHKSTNPVLNACANKDASH